MQCQDMEKFIHVYLDREFAEEDRADYERHLAECEQCRRLARFEQRFKAQLKTSLAYPRMRLDEREAVRARIMQTLAEAPPLPAEHGVKRWILRLVPAAAAAGVLMALVLGEGDVHPLMLGSSLLVSEPGPVPEKITRDPHVLREWYRRKLGIAVLPPRFTDGRTSLVGGRIGRVDSSRAAHLIYSRGDSRFSVTVSASQRIPSRGVVSRRMGDRSVFFSYGQDHNAATFRHHGVVYTIAGSLPRRDLDSLVLDVLRDGAGLPAPHAVDAVQVKAP